MSFSSSGSQPEPQITLITFQPAPRKFVSSSWMIFPFPRTGPSRRCRLQLIDEDEVVELLAAGERDRAHRLRLVHLAVAHERPDLSVARVDDVARGQVLHEPGLVDRHQRAEAHRDGRELPELGHQPRVRIRREPAAVDLLPEAAQVLLGQPSLEERARVDARRRVTLDVDEVAAVLLGAGAPEMVEADLVERLGRLVARDVAAELGRLGVRLQDDRDRVPADERRCEPLELADRPGAPAPRRPGSC